ncbi:hypothetical protein INT45_013795 [Circinella minor]|uniref:Uncharacterized protein n=1 Tax=Circinella minor TaxID=1195481 RepID=A0A8H7RG13_9FUNG|nr:hypothetical protein INT45_013795 [Circinella minor]
MEETIRVNPFLLKRGGKGTSVREDAWKQIAQRMNQLEQLDGTTEKQQHVIRFGSGVGGGHDTRLERCYKDLLKMALQAEHDHNAAALKQYQDEQRVQIAALTGRCVTSSTQKDKRHRHFSDVGQDVNAHESKDSDSFIASFAKLAIKEEKDLELLKKQ